MLEGVRILAVHHDPGRNGAALLFQSVLEGLVHDHGAIVSMTVPRDGPLVARAQALGPVRVVPVRPASRTFASRVARRLRRGVPQKRERKYDLIFANSAASLGAVEKMLPGSEIPLAVYVHESGYLLQHAGDFAATTRLLRRAAVIFAATPLVRDTIEDLVRPTAKIVIASPFVPVRPITDATSDMPTDVRASLSSGAQIVGAVGTMSWYKGTDLFVVVARRVRELLPDHDVKFVWIGEEWRSETRHQLEHDVEIAHLEDVVLLPGGMEDPTAFLRSLSLLLLPSREDSWPLAMLEAAAEGVPMVCFQNSGGAEQFVASGGGTAVPYLDVEAMAHAVVRYLSDPELMAADARIARENATSVTAVEQIRMIASELATVTSLGATHG